MNETDLFIEIKSLGSYFMTFMSVSSFAEKSVNAGSICL